ncbi:MAG: glycosyltransferase family 4 protein [Hyphomicrobiaceae bacterium]
MPRVRPTILQIIPRLDTGGAELSTIEMTSAIVRAGGRALVATEGGRMADLVVAAGGEIVWLPVATKNPMRMLANSRDLQSLARGGNIQLMHARSRAPAWSALMAARRGGFPFVTTYHGAYVERNRLKSIYKSVMARGDRVIANSGYTASLITSRYAVDASTVRIIHRGVDLSRFDPAKVAPDRRDRLRQAWSIGPTDRVVLQAARLTGWKGQQTLLEAAARLRGKGQLRQTVLVLAGDDQGRVEYKQGLWDLARRLDIADNVRIPGHVDDIPAAFAIAHVGVVASSEPEAFGRAAIEAQAMACPIIATDIGAPPETVLDDHRAPKGTATGWLVTPRDEGALATALEAALELSSEQRHEIGIRARRHVAAHFTVESMQLATLSTYDELLGTRLAEAFRSELRSFRTDGDLE